MRIYIQSCIYLILIIDFFIQTFYVGGTLTYLILCLIIMYMYIGTCIVIIVEYLLVDKSFLKKKKKKKSVATLAEANLLIGMKNLDFYPSPHISHRPSHTCRRRFKHGGLPPTPDNTDSSLSPRPWGEEPGSVGVIPAVDSQY